jgi:hypothetical protein
VGKRQALGQIFVEAEGAREGSRDLRDLERMGEARAVMVAFGGHEYLGLVLEAAERRRMDHAVAVALEGRAQRARRFRPAAPAAGPGLASKSRFAPGTRRKQGGIRLDCGSPDHPGGKLTSRWRYRNVE